MFSLLINIHFSDPDVGLGHPMPTEADSVETVSQST